MRIITFFLFSLLTAGLVSGCTLTIPSSATTPVTTPDASTTARVIQHALGTTTMPSAPQRIIALGEEWLLDDLLALDIRPIASTVNLPDAVPGVTAQELAGIELLSSGEVSLEHLAELQPDLIIGNRYFIEQAGYDTLRQLAPTIALSSTLPLEAFVETAAIFDLTATAQAQVDEFRASVASAAAQFADGERAISVATIYPGASLAVWGAGPTSTPQLLLDLGFSLHPDAVQLGSAMAANGRAFVSLEELTLLDSELLILLQSSVVEGEDESVAEIQNDPLWATLPAVQSGRVHVLDRLGYPGFRGQLRLLDDLVTYLAPAAAPITAETTTTSATRIYTHALGESEIPTDPHRIVVLDAVDNLLALGVKPVGGAQWVGTASGIAASWPSYIDPAMVEGITFLGPTNTPNLEQIVLLDPDLIIGRLNFHEEIYPQLREIAPTVILDIKNSGQWRAEFFAYADLVGRTPQAATLMAAYEARAAAIAERLAALDANPEVSLVRIDPERIVMYQTSLFIGQVLSDAGVKRPATQAVDNSSEQLSLETISQLDADVIFAIESNPAEAKYQALVDTPLWHQLRAVQNERVYAVPFDLWIGGWTINGAHAVLDQLETYLLAE